MSPIILALDVEQESDAFAIVNRIDPKLCRLKVGKGLFTRYGPALVEKLMRNGYDIFLDLKFHDIPNTVALACQSAANLNVWMMNVHCMGGQRMLQAAQGSIADRARRPIILGVTVLTSMDDKDLKQIGINFTATEMVQKLAALAQQTGLDGVVCSAQEASILRQALGAGFVLVTPGIRLSTDTADDQRRIVTPKQAMQNGADYLVIGRPVLNAADPVKVLEQIAHEIS